MSTADAETARSWLARAKVRQTGDLTWVDDDLGSELSANDVALDYSSWVFDDADLEVALRFRIAFGLIDLLDEYWTTQEMHFPYCGSSREQPPAELWDGYRDRLEAPQVSEQVTQSLWYTWFECTDTSEEAFVALLGHDVELLEAGGVAGGMGGGVAGGVADDGFLRRAARVLTASGPVRWGVKARAYEAASSIEALRPAVFHGLLRSYHDYFGDLEPGPALTILDDLGLAPGTEHLAELRTVLAAGHSSHVANPEVWAAAQGQ
ncbi:hypothetical protein APR04_004410 [Promicromonospora umidemergens]|uniref:Uncharacterized protein n=1 Tax=Promicromonospora umidemergens TaxID=629679 RepID=A0ABP8WXL6_9MICO|nr:hypothetical protein [Promicromonospora umidemergens]MCP2285475.1 hypothetical protein [Promicromonospora umidemergens]